MKQFKHKKGFTLIELIVVMSIIGILVLLAVPKFVGHTKEAKFTKLISNTKEIETASERYYMDKQNWPRVGDIPYTAEQIKTYAQKVYDATGKNIALDPDGKYYDVDFDKLSKYVNVYDDKTFYIIQNPVGNVYALEGLSQEGVKRTPIISATSVTLNVKTLTLNVGETEKLRATIQPDNTTNKALKWSSSDESIAKVDNYGVVTAIKDGIATIRVSSVDNGVSDECVLTVNQGVTGIILNTSNASVVIGSTFQLTATVQPPNATNKNVIWESSNEGIATVNSSGLITGVSSGNATVTAKTQDGNFTATANITVKAPFTNKTFTYSGNYETFIVPQTGTYKLEVWGAQGESVKYKDVLYGVGSKGGYAYGNKYFTEGQALYIYVGQKAVGKEGGYNGGGNGGTYNIYYNAGGGGGATDIRTVSGTWNNPASLQSRVIVAGGGGGVGYQGLFVPPNTYNGGAGGGTTGGGGASFNFNDTSYAAGTGGTQTAGGTGYTAGSLGVGGGGMGGGQYSQGGGGGGGYYGGGGAKQGAGGGGGSSYIGGLANAGTTAGVQTGNGKVVITFVSP